MPTMTSRNSQQGATLIELVIGLVIFGILFAASAQTFRAWMVNVQIRNAAEALQNGLQVARNDAIRHNINVEFRLTTGTGWTVVEVPLPSATVQSRAAEEGSPNVTVTVTPPGATRLTFNSLGRVVTPTNADGSVPITQLDIDVPSSVLAAADVKKLRILTANSQIRMCDPKVSDVNDPRHC